VREPSARTSTRRKAARPDELVELHAFCRDGRLYDVEGWIQTGRPLQLSEPAAKGRVTSALQIGLDAGNQALVLLLLSNGYDPNGELNSPLDLALSARRFDLVDLLLKWGADAHRVNLGDLFDTYSSCLYQRFLEQGVDLTEGHALAEAIAYHTSNKPLLGFAKRHRLTNKKIQAELDIALAHHAGEGNEKGVQLCLWAGANAHVAVPNLRFRSISAASDEDEDGEAFLGFSAVNEACQRGHLDIFKRLRPDPTLDDFEELWRSAASPEIIDELARHGLPKNVVPVIQHHLWWATFTEGSRWIGTLRRVFEVGVRWQHSTPDGIAGIRRHLLKAKDSTFIDLMKILATAEFCSPEVLRELGRTASIRDRMKQVGFIESSEPRNRYGPLRPTGSREVVKKFGVEPPPSKRARVPVARSVQIGPRQVGDVPIRLSREELYERVWSKAVDTVAKECGLSGPGLKKICKRLSVPVPPRGYWAKLKAGKSVRRATLPRLPVET